jgi:hypothetical protein
MYIIILKLKQNLLRKMFRVNCFHYLIFQRRLQNHPTRSIALYFSAF